jgi:anti-anti-sigma factor
MRWTPHGPRPELPDAGQPQLPEPGGGDRTRVRVSAPAMITIENRAGILRHLLDCGDLGVRDLTLDLGATVYVDSAGLAMLLQAYRTLARCGARLQLGGASPELRTLFEAIRLDHLLASPATAAAAPSPSSPRLQDTPMSTPNVSISATPDLIAEESSVGVVVYAVLNGSYTPTYGPAANTSIAQGSWVYLWTGTFDGATVFDYAPASGLGTASLPAVASLTSTTPLEFPLPAAPASGQLLFGVPDIPSIPAAAPSPPAPVGTPGIYDFVEYTYATSPPSLNVDTTMIDQFGIPMQIALDLPAGVPNPLPNGSGVCQDRADVLSQFLSSIPAAFQQCIQDLFLQPIAGPLRILSPKDVLVYQSVQGVTASQQPNSNSTLAGVCYYGVAAVNAAGDQGYLQGPVVMADVQPGNQVTVSWGTNGSQPQSTDIVSYNVYRSVSPVGPWTLIGSPPASTFPSGCSWLDTGQSLPPIGSLPQANPLCTWYDTAIHEFFAHYGSGNALALSVVQSGYGSVGTVNYAEHSWKYSFSGTTTTDAATGLSSLQFLVTNVFDLTTNSAVTELMPFASSTPFNLYYPYWNTNSDSTASPAPCPAGAPAGACTATPGGSTWMLYPEWPASLMVFGASGVFADNIQQVYLNLPSQVAAPTSTYPAAPPPDTPAGLWQSLLGALENMVVAAITRGIAAPVGTGSALPVAPANWANQPTQLAPTPSAALSSETPGTYYYVVTALNGAGESTPSFEFSIQTTTAKQSVQVNWLPLPSWQATAFNVYRGTSPGGENTLVPGSGLPATSGGSLVDSGGGTAQTPPAYYPAGAAFDAYAAFFHQPTISIGGAAYASPYDDQGNQSSDQAGDASSLTVMVGPWAKGCGACNG